MTPQFLRESRVDHEFFVRELQSFLPDQIFDAHAHLWCQEWVSWSLEGAGENLGYQEYQQAVGALHQGRPTTALFIPFIEPTSRDKSLVASEWVAAQIEDHPDCSGLFFVRPEDDPEWVREQVRRFSLSGLKCYHTMASTTPTMEAKIEDYLPERLLKVADEEAWAITLHIVKSRAVADPENSDCLRRYCENYPNAKLILAHSARGFQPAHNLAGLEQLTGLDNLYFDTSANCEPIAHQAILRLFGHEKLLYGSDFPVSHFRGRTVAAADSFLWLTQDSPCWQAAHAKIDPVLIGLEHLRSLKHACWSERLSDSQIEDLFWNNAARLFGTE